jgi:hypothetical protein
VAAVSSVPVFLKVLLVPAVGHVPVLMVVESNGRLAQVRVAAVFNARIDPVEERVQVRTEAAFNGRIDPDDRVKMAEGFGPIGRMVRPMAAFPIRVPIVPARAAAARGGTATTGATGPISGRIVSPIAISGTTGETIDARTSGTTGTTSGTTTITGSTMIGGINITFTGHTTTTSTVGAGRRGRG